ncbi:CaiB/BaiF CoA transferase family protein [Rhodococcus qingshengii]|uniref:Alpha-methylacyl-CoA racemase n=1 Tax=Electrophorus voltai TaxID=2609070 RepID=A0AAD8YPV8_9TELE|nr:CaiB/BaiF CoA-transferase family protein [Rhodococcus qingshengii]KAK1784566.1 hypothetical protein P4O66_004335 [Electrophorus voltai]QXC46865.1 CoA transferase [Rhodococcus qingshengii]
MRDAANAGTRTPPDKTDGSTTDNHVLQSSTAGPLHGVKVLELGGIGPGPFAGMLLADLGADVIRVDRLTGTTPQQRDSHLVLHRGRRSLALDLRREQGRDVVLELAQNHDVIIEGFRPGVAERLGVGPREILERNPRIVYGRMTGWGQEGPLANAAGHDINYIALAGALESIAAPDGTPVPPLNMLGDFGGGGMLMALGVVAAVLNARQTGIGQVVDAAIVDGASLMTAMLHSMAATGRWNGERRANLLDGGAPFYGVYRTLDDRWLAVGAIEPQFYTNLLDGLGLADELAGIAQDDRSFWPTVRERIAARIAERTRTDWESVFDRMDACVCAVLSPDEVIDHPHIRARGTFFERDGHLEPSPAPRFSVTPTATPPPAPQSGADTRKILADTGFRDEVIDRLIAANVVAEV